ncbi:P-loop containing nucleoside triphosphate hydrolase protein [Dipodascopsis tothii]|uniref:P-loop containing nucleoside triphosphate hydrolase protein n=1 Tax=Dipodascopsis tothii TaxID=44089 RepID=UPI0034CD7CCF
MAAPAPAPPPGLSVSASLPEACRSVFPFGAFNRMQTRCFTSLYESDENVVISSPTGSGKTVLFELAMVRLFLAADDGAKAVYMAPTKALCMERHADWTRKFGVLGKTCGLLTGDTALEDVSAVKRADIIVTTPEKWDSVTRKWADYDRMIGLVRLLLVDEVHMLQDSRGATLEVVVSRMKHVSVRCRFVLLSATIPNAGDIAEWIGRADAAAAPGPAVLHVFDDSYRPVRLEQHIYGYATTSFNDFQLDRVYDGRLMDVISRHYLQRPIIIFCSTRKITVATAKFLARAWGKGRRIWPACTSPDARRFQDRDLAEVVPSGVAFHNAGLSLTDRGSVEQLFLGGQLAIICCTSTLAVGVNLPAHMVIIKGTTTWADGRSQDYSAAELLQMMGRAGRPQFDTSGVAVIMTTADQKSHFVQVLSGKDPVESSLHRNLTEHMNAEVCLQTVRDVGSAVRWLKSTFLYVRMRKNTAHYNIHRGARVSSLERMLERICVDTLNDLNETDLITIDGSERLEATDYGRAMALFYVQFPTARSFIRAPLHLSTGDVLLLLAQANEFKELRMKPGERKFFKDLSQAEGMRFDFAGDLGTPAGKVHTLVQAVLGRADLPASDDGGRTFVQFQTDKMLVWQHINRLAKCLVECRVLMQDAVSVRSALGLSRALAAEVWELGPEVLMQLDGIGPATLRKFVARDVRSFADLAALETRHVEEILGLNPGRGQRYLKDVSSIPTFGLGVRKLAETAVAGVGVRLKLEVSVQVLNETVPTRFRKRQLTAVVMSEFSSGAIVDFRRTPLARLGHGTSFLLYPTVTAPVAAVRCSISCDEIGTCPHPQR